MLNSKLCRKKLKIVFIALSLFSVTGCPGYGDRLRPFETTTVSGTSERVCFQVIKPQDYQLSLIIIAPRQLPLNEREYIDNPDLPIKHGEICILPSFYKFPRDGQFVVDYTLTSKKYKNEPRRVVSGLEILEGSVHTVTLDQTEF